MYLEINQEDTDESAARDARIFIEEAKLFRNEYEGSKQLIIYFEEFILGIAKIVSFHGMKPIDQLILRFIEINKNK